MYSRFASTAFEANAHSMHNVADCYIKVHGTGMRSLQDAYPDAHLSIEGLNCLQCPHSSCFPLAC